MRKKKIIQANYHVSGSATVFFFTTIVSFISVYKFHETFPSIIINLIRVSEILCIVLKYYNVIL